MSTYGTSAFTSSAQSVTSQKKRDVADMHRFLAPAGSLTKFIATGGIDLPEGVKREKGMISKRKVKNKKFEVFYQSPMAVEFTVSSAVAGTSVTVSDASGLSTDCRYSLVNTSLSTSPTCTIDSISSNTISYTSYGTTSFSASAGDKLLVLSSHFEQNSTAPAIVYQDPTNSYNLTFIARYAAGISGTALAEAHYGTGSKWQDLMKNNNWEGMRKVSYNMWLDNLPSSGETTSNAASKAFGSMDGIVQWASNEHNFAGSFTYEAFTEVMGTKFHESVRPEDTKLFCCGYNVWAQILGWEQDSLRVQSGSYERFGHESFKLITARGWIEVVIMDIFNRGDLQTQAMIICPERWQYVYLADRDFNAYQGQKKVGIGANDLDGTKVEIRGEMSFCPDDGGENALHLKNIPLLA